jgi:hypothetical protein
VSVSNDKKLRARIRRLVKNHPDLVMEALLDQPFWPQSLSSQESYQRFGDDDKSFLKVVFSSDGDAWPYVYMYGDPQHLSSSPRYRTHFGGGQSLRTRTAICILAAAIAKDNAERPQARAQ